MSKIDLKKPKKEISLSKFRKWGYIIMGVLMTIAIVSLFVKIPVSVSKETINTKISQKLPIVIKKEIKIPLMKKKEVTISISQITTKFHKDDLKADFIGTFSYKDEQVPFTATTNGDIDYQNFNFYFKPTNIEVHFDEEILQIIAKKYKEKSISKLNEKKDLIKSKLSFIKFKKKEVKTPKNVDNISLLDEQINEKIKSVLKKVEPLVGKSITKYLQSQPIYKIKDNKDIDSSIKTFLDDIMITEEGITVTLTTVNFLKSFLWVFIIVLLIFGFGIHVTHEVDKKGKFDFFDILEVVVEVGVNSLETVGSGVGEAVGGVGDVLGGL